MNYPIYLSTFIGRKTERSEIKSLIREKTIRLLTLTGPGGSGKTRLAYETLPEFSDVFEDGLFWVELVGLSDPYSVPQAVASSLEVNAAPGKTPLDSLTIFLQNRESLVVLDNCEHLLDACGELVDALLRACPALHFLVTSRHRLGVEGEQVWHIPPLSYPADIALPPDALDRYDALRLFAARAKQVHPSFEISLENAPDLVRISQLLDGMPLSIELAASWVSVLDTAQIAKRLEDQLALLAKRDRSNDDRHRSIRETIRWSHDLLSDEEKALFRRLGVFCGGFSLEAVESVCSGEPLGKERILKLMGRLIDQSLVVKERAQGGGSRYRQLESIRQFAKGNLQEAGEVNQMRDQHLRFFANLIREAEPHLLGADQKTWTEKLDADHENLQAALSWSLSKTAEDEDRQALEETIQMVNGLYWFWNYTDRSEVGRDWYEKVLDLPGIPRGTAEYADLTRHMATYVWLLGDYPAAQSQLRESLEVAQSVNYSNGIGHSKLLLGVMALHQGRNEQAIRMLLESEELFKSLGDQRGLGITRTNLGGAFLETGDLEAARAYTEEVVRSARANRDLWGLGLSLSGLADVVFRQGEMEKGVRLMEEALDVLQQSGQLWLSAEAMWRLANMMEGEGDFEGAEKQLEQCFALAQECGALQWQITALESLGFLSLNRGDSQRAGGHFAEALRMIPGQEFKNIQLRLFLGIVQLAAREQKWEQAVTLWGAYQGLKETEGLPASKDETQVLKLLGTLIESPQYSHLLHTEKGRSLQEAASLALEIVEGIREEVIAAPSKFELRMLALGPIEVYLKDKLLVPSDWTFAKPKELLFYLVSNPPKTKEQIGLVFWQDASPSQLRTSLRAALYQLRRTLGKREWILYEDGYYRFNRDMNFWYDVEDFETGIVEAEKLAGNSPNLAVEKYESAVQLYRGDFLADIATDEWGVLRREDLKRKYHTAMTKLGELYIDNGAYDRAIESFHKLLDSDNLLEEAHRGLMYAYIRKGERGFALRQYQSLVEILQDELGVTPSPETDALYESLQRGSI